jgi:hypothetical protein
MNWKGILLEWTYRGILPALATVLTLALFRAPWATRGADGVRPGLAAAVWLVTRAIYAAVLYVALGYEGVPDYRSWIAWHAEPVLAGGIPGVDFRNGYGPFLPWLQGGGMALVGHPVGVLIPFLIGDALVLWATTRMARDLGGAAAERWTCGWLVLSPILWHQVVVNGQDEPLFAGLLLTGVLLLHRGHDVAGGAFLALGLCATKITFGLYGAAAALALLPEWRRFARCTVAGLAVAGAVCGAFLALGATLFQYTLDRHLQSKGAAGGSLPDFLLSMGFLDADQHRRLLPWVVALVLLCVLAGAFRRSQGLYLPRALGLVAVAHALFTGLMPGALTGYAGQGIAVLLLLLLVHGRGPWTVILAWTLPLLALATSVQQKMENWLPAAIPIANGAFKGLTLLAATLAVVLFLRPAVPGDSVAEESANR